MFVEKIYPLVFAELFSSFSKLSQEETWSLYKTRSFSTTYVNFEMKRPVLSWLMYFTENYVINKWDYITKKQAVKNISNTTTLH